MVQEEEKEAQEEEKEAQEEEAVDEDEEKEESEEPDLEQEQMELPPVNFENFLFGLYNTARFHLGVQNPETGELMQNLPVARHTIDTLVMLQEKTKGNLAAPESNLMENLLYELRMSYLRMSKQAEDAPREKPETEGDAAEPEVEPEAQEASDEDSC